MMNKIVAIIPTLNEEIHIHEVIDKCTKVANSIFVVDGLSTDRTREIVKKKFPEVKILLEKRKGKGVALRKGISYALKQNPDYVVMLDGDGEKDPNDIPKILEWLENKNADMVVGFRARKRSLERHIFNFFASWWIRFATSYKLRDCLSGFNAIKTESLKKMNLISNNFEIETELILEARKNGLEVIEYPVSFPEISPSKLNGKHMREINNFFDIWTLKWIKSKKCDLPFYKRMFLSFFCRIGLLIFR